MFDEGKVCMFQRMKIDLMGDDVIEIRDGDSGSTPLLEKYTASNNDDVDLPLSQSEPVIGKRFVFSTSNVMYVIMRTSGSTSGTGFSFQYRQGTFYPLFFICSMSVSMNYFEECLFSLYVL